MKPDSQSRVDRPGIEQYMSQVVEFREKLIVLMHITARQLARWPELGSIRYSNIVKGGHRNSFSEDGIVAMATRYHKGY